MDNTSINILDKIRELMTKDQERSPTARISSWMEYCEKCKPVLIEYDFNRVEFLKTKKKRRPQAEFVCNVCHYFCDSTEVVSRHISVSKHKTKLRDFLAHNTAQSLPDSPKELTDTLSVVLEETARKHCMTEECVLNRERICHALNSCIADRLPECSLVLCGSSVHGLGLADADVNLSLAYSKDLSRDIILTLADILEESMSVELCLEDEMYPYISFKTSLPDNSELYDCKISFFSDSQVNLAHLLRKYGNIDPRFRTLCVLVRLWAESISISLDNDGSCPPHLFYLLVLFYLQQQGVLPVLHAMCSNRPKTDADTDSQEYFDPDLHPQFKWQSSSTKTIGELWLGFFRFFSVEFDPTKRIVSVTHEGPLFRRHKEWGGKRIAVEDPFQKRRNIMRSCHFAFYDYLMSCFLSTYLYYGIPRTQAGPIFGYIQPTPVVDEELLSETSANFFWQQKRLFETFIQCIPALDSTFKKSSLDVSVFYELQHFQVSYERGETLLQIDKIALDKIFAGAQNRKPPFTNQYKDLNVFQSGAEYLMKSIDPKFVKYEFDVNNRHYFTNSKTPPMCCKICLKEGHGKEACLEEKLAPLPVLEPLSPKTISCLDKACNEIYDQHKNADRDYFDRLSILQELETFIKEKVYPDAQLTLFGSSCNGFGLTGSDMDICLSFKDMSEAQRINGPKLTISLYAKLSKFNKVTKLVCIPWAKVPIIKFKHKGTGIEGDISIHNTLAIENTKLLNAYAMIDARAQRLGLMAKSFAKLCHIGKASKGSLSSYCYTLMVIYFLQRCSPPILPVLQELTEDGGEPPKLLSKGCNVYFYNNIDKLPEIWPHYRTNAKTVGELWFEYLKFYAEDFDMEKDVVSIRTIKKVTKLNKIWFGSTLAVEDPFDLSHNLGSRLTRKMNFTITKTFQKATAHFGTPIKKCTKSISQYYFDKRLFINNHGSHKGRTCFKCGKVGHLKADCPPNEPRDLEENVGTGEMISEEVFALEIGESGEGEEEEELL